MAVLASELWWVLLVIGCAEAIRRGVTLWVVFPAALLVDIWLTLQLEVIRSFWLWLLNVLVLSVIVQMASAVATLESFEDLPDEPPAADPTPRMLELAAAHRAVGFTPVTDRAVVVGEPAVRLWVLRRDDGTLAELVHTEPHEPGFGYRTELDPPAPGYDTVESVPWVGGWPGPTARRVAIAKAPWRTLLSAHDAAVAEAVALGARPVPVGPEDALAKVLASDRDTARRAMATPWRSVLRTYRRLLPSRSS